MGEEADADWGAGLIEWGREDARKFYGEPRSTCLHKWSDWKGVRMVTRSSTDIVERLRSNYASPHHGGCQNCYGIVMDDAADEIERLSERVLAYKELLKRAQRTIERDYPNGQLAIDIRAILSTNPGEQE